MNVKEIVGQMTLEEKAAMTTGVGSWHTYGIDRLDVPSIRMSDGPHGLRLEVCKEDGTKYTATEVSFPAECSVAASFDRDVARKVGEALGDECQAQNVQVLLGPGVNIKRSPLCGRNFEYMSEDPCLAGEMAAAYVDGVQSKGVGTSLKHFFANNQETRRNTGSSELDERTMREIYLSAFETVVKKSQPWTIMASYNRINGTFATENRDYLTDVLRKEWGFEGVVVSDWGATHDRVKAVAAGTDLTMPGEENTTDQIIKAVEDGSLPESVLDEACERILALVEKGIAGKRSVEKDLERAHAVSLMAEEESAVLLKNENKILPLRKDAKIAFVGEFAQTPRFQGGGSSNVRVEKEMSLLEAVSGVAQVDYYQGYDGIKTNQVLLDEAVQGAKQADVAVIFAGLPQIMESEGLDRQTMAMPESHNTLISEIAKVQQNVVVVLMNGSPVEMPWVHEVSGILEMYLGGEGLAEACVNLLFGDKNPSGRLPESFPLRLEDNPSYLYYFGDKKRVYYNEGVYVGYRYYESKKMDVLYPFGYGLSYTNFAYSNLKLDKSKLLVDDTLTVSVDVTNTGDRTGKEVVQLYVAVKECAVPRPVKELRGFEKIELKPQETKTVSFVLDKRAFSYWNVDAHQFHVEAGKFEIQIGASAHDVICSAPVETEREYLEEQIEYSMVSLIEDMVKNPIGAAFWESHTDELIDGIMASGIVGDVMGDDNMIFSLPREQLREMVKSMYGQSIGTLQMFLPSVDINEWTELLRQMNQFTHQ